MPRRTSPGRRLFLVAKPPSPSFRQPSPSRVVWRAHMRWPSGDSRRQRDVGCRSCASWLWWACGDCVGDAFPLVIVSTVQDCYEILGMNQRRLLTNSERRRVVNVLRAVESRLLLLARLRVWIEVELQL